MAEPWFNPKMIGMLGVVIGSLLGPITGTLGGVFVPKGKAKKLVLGFQLFTIALSLVLIVIGVVAYLAGQPRSIWWGFGYTGLLCTVIFSIIFVVFLKRYRDAELRKSMSEDLTLGGNNDLR